MVIYLKKIQILIQEFNKGVNNEYTFQSLVIAKSIKNFLEANYQWILRKFSSINELERGNEFWDLTLLKSKDYFSSNYINTLKSTKNEIYKFLLETSSKNAYNSTQFNSNSRVNIPVFDSSLLNSVRTLTGNSYRPISINRRNTDYRIFLTLLITEINDYFKILSKDNEELNKIIKKISEKIIKLKDKMSIMGYDITNETNFKLLLKTAKKDTHKLKLLEQQVEEQIKQEKESKKRMSYMISISAQNICAKLHGIYDLVFTILSNNVKFGNRNLYDDYFNLKNGIDYTVVANNDRITNIPVECFNDDNKLLMNFTKDFKLTSIATTPDLKTKYEISINQNFPAVLAMIYNIIVFGYQNISHKFKKQFEFLSKSPYRFTNGIRNMPNDYKLDINLRGNEKEKLQKRLIFLALISLGQPGMKLFYPTKKVTVSDLVGQSVDKFIERYRLNNYSNYVVKKSKGYSMYFKLFYNDELSKVDENNSDLAYHTLNPQGFKDGNAGQNFDLNMDQLLLLLTKSYVILKKFYENKQTFIDNYRMINLMDQGCTLSNNIEEYKLDTFGQKDSTLVKLDKITNDATKNMIRLLIPTDLISNARHATTATTGLWILAKCSCYGMDIPLMTNRRSVLCLVDLLTGNIVFNIGYLCNRDDVHYKSSTWGCHSKGSKALLKGQRASRNVSYIKYPWDIFGEFLLYPLEETTSFQNTEYLYFSVTKKNLDSKGFVVEEDKVDIIDSNGRVSKKIREEWFKELKMLYLNIQRIGTSDPNKTKKLINKNIKSFKYLNLISINKKFKTYYQLSTQPTPQTKNEVLRKIIKTWSTYGIYYLQDTTRPQDYPPLPRPYGSPQSNSSAILSVSGFFNNLKRKVLGIIHLRGGAKKKENLHDLESIENMKELLIEMVNPNVNIYYNKNKLITMKKMLKKINKLKPKLRKKIKKKYMKGGFLDSFYKII